MCPRRTGAWRRRLLVVLCALSFAGTTGTSLFAAEQARPAPAERTPAVPTAAQVAAAEYLLKAAFIYNFAKFTAFPGEAFAGTEGPLRICIIGADTHGPAFDTIDGKIVEGRRVATRFLADTTRLDGCPIVFLGEARRAALGALIGATAGRPVLTISDVPDFARNGGMIGLKSIDDQVRFEINLEAATRVGLQFSSRLLRLADIVTEGPSIGGRK